MAKDVFIPDEHLEGFTPRERQELLDHIDMDTDVDLTVTERGRALLAQLKAVVDAKSPNPPRIPEPGEMPPMHLRGVELERWIERQRRQAFLPDDVEG